MLSILNGKGVHIMNTTKPYIDDSPTIKNGYFIFAIKKAIEDQKVQGQILLTYGENHPKGKEAMKCLEFLNVKIKTTKERLLHRGVTL
jgi:hypothetical protein